MGEVLEKLGRPKHAKIAYMKVRLKDDQWQTLKIKEKEGELWKRIGFIEVNQLNRPDLAETCF